MIETNTDDTTTLTLDQVLRRFSEKQLGVAITWAKHFCTSPEEWRPFIREYLRNSSTPPVWCVTHELNGRRIAIARFGSILQWFNGTTVRTTVCESKLRIPRAKPGIRAVQGLAKRIDTLPYNLNGGLLTSFSQKARDLAAVIARNDLGKKSDQVASLDDRSPHMRYLRPRSRYYLRMIGAALREFCSALDSNLLFAVRSVQCVSPQLYNWLASGDKQRRLQALRAQPILLPMLILSDHREVFPWPYDKDNWVQPPWPALNMYIPSTVEAGFGDGNGFLGQVADDGLPLGDALAWLLKAPKASIRYLGTCRPGRAGGALFHIRGAGHEAWERMLVGAGLGNRRPATKTDWQALYSLLQKIPYQVKSPDYKVTSKPLPLDLNLLLKGTPTAWNDASWPNIEGTLTDYQEFYRHLDYASGKTSEVATQFFVRKSFGQIANMVNQFHCFMDSLLIAMRVELETVEDDSLMTWPALLPYGNTVSPNGVSIVELRCPADLDTEHAVMKHCINTYDYSAFSGTCRLISFRKGTTVLASAEIRLSRKPEKQFHCVQLRGVSNQPVPSDAPAGRACTWFMQGLESGRIVSNQEWPDQTRRLKRFAKSQWEYRVSEAVQAWITQNMGGQL